jgi:hypothetical protein
VTNFLLMCVLPRKQMLYRRAVLAASHWTCTASRYTNFVCNGVCFALCCTHLQTSGISRFLLDMKAKKYGKAAQKHSVEYHRVFPLSSVSDTCHFDVIAIGSSIGLHL